MLNPYKLKGRAFALFSLLFLFSFTLFAQVGINTTTPTITLDVNGVLSLREHPEVLPLNTGFNNNINLSTNPFSQYRIESPTAAFSIAGIQAVAIADGQIVRLVNYTDQIMTIVHNAPSTGDSRKIICPAEADLVLAGKNSSVTLQYSKEFLRWTVFGYASKNINNKYFVNTPYGTGTDETQNSENWKDLMSINFTPANPVVYITYSV